LSTTTALEETGPPDLLPGRLGFGAAGIGNLYREVSDEDARAALDAAWDGGIRYFDTAPHYGLGLSERRLGQFLQTRPRNEFRVSTKVGRILRPNPDFHGQPDDGGFAVPARTRREWAPDEAGVRASLEESLERMGLDSVDILYLHDPDAYNLEEGISAALPALEKLRAEGLVKAIGVGANSADALLRCVENADLDLIMLAGRYTLLEQPALADLLPACRRLDVGVVNVGVFNSGLLASSSVRDDAHYNYQPAPQSVIDHARRLAAVCSQYDVALPAAAIQFSLRHPAVKTVVVGARTADQIRQNIAHMDVAIPEQLWEALADEGLVPAE
jgi:D-threo-aldose 1-dehydrogenase